MTARLCSIEGCDQPARARGWCNCHYQRWQRLGDPNSLLGRDNIRRRDAVRHGTRRGYELGCKCFPCRVASSKYQRAWANSGPTRTPIGQVIAHVDRLIESGWTRQEIQREADLGNSTIWHLKSGRQKSVNSRTATAILALQPFGQPAVDLDPTPLLRHLEVARRAGRLTLSPTDRRALDRAVKAGRISEPLADRIAVKALGLTVENIYGLEVAS